MKGKIPRAIPFALALSMFGSMINGFGLPAARALESAPSDGLPAPLYHDDSIRLRGTGDIAKPISNEGIEAVRTLEEGTIIVRFMAHSTTASIQSLLSVSDGSTANSHFHLYIQAGDSGRAGFEIRRNSGGDFQKAYVPVNIPLGRINTLAFKADQTEENYKIFLNGSLILVSPKAPTTGYGFIGHIPNIEREIHRKDIPEYQNERLSFLRRCVFRRYLWRSAAGYGFNRGYRTIRSSKPRERFLSAGRFPGGHEIV